MRSVTRAQRKALQAVAWLGFLGLFAWFYRQALWTYFSQDDFPLLITSKPGDIPILNFFKAGGPSAYRPVTQHFYFYFNQLLFGFDPVGHHLANMAVHLINALLVGMLAQRWVAAWTFLPAAFAYAFHPVHFFEVYWISAITQSGYLFFLLSTLLCFSLYRSRAKAAFAIAAYVAAVCAFLSKEDSVALPLIVTLSALLPLATERLSRRRLAVSLIPFWLLLGAFWAFRLWVMGMGLPNEGAYIFSFDLARTGDKIWNYSLWLFKGRVWSFALALAGLCIGVLVWRLGKERGQERRNFILRALLLAAMASASIAPSFLIPSTVEYYLSFPSAVLAWMMALLLDRLPAGWLRAIATALLLSSLFHLGWEGRNFRLSVDDLYVPLPRKAEMCRHWVEKLRLQRPPPEECDLLFRDVPMPSAWEKEWFIYLPMVAWKRIYPHVAAHTQQDPEPDMPSGQCIRVWSFADGDAVLMEASGGE